MRSQGRPGEYCASRGYLLAGPFSSGLSSLFSHASAAYANAVEHRSGGSFTQAFFTLDHSHHRSTAFHAKRIDHLPSGHVTIASVPFQ